MLGSFPLYPHARSTNNACSLPVSSLNHPYVSALNHVNWVSRSFFLVTMHAAETSPSPRCKWFPRVPRFLEDSTQPTMFWTTNCGLDSPAYVFFGPQTCGMLIRLSQGRSICPCYHHTVRSASVFLPISTSSPTSQASQNSTPVPISSLTNRRLLPEATRHPSG